MGLAQGLDTGIAGEGPLTVFSLDDGGALHAQAMDGTSDMIEIVCSPRMLASVFSPAIDDARAQAGMMGAFAGAGAGISPDDINMVLDGLFAAPAMLERATLTVKQAGSSLTTLDVRIEVTPIAESAAASAFSLLVPSKGGFLDFREKGAMVNYALDLSQGAVNKLLGPMTVMLSSMTAKGDTKKEMRDTMRKAMGATSGTQSGSWAANSGMVAVAGLTDPETYKATIASEAYFDLMRDSLEETGIEVEISQEQYHGTELITTIQELPEQPMPNPLAPDGKMRTTVALAGDKAIIVMFSQGGEAKAAIDRVLEKAPKPAKLPNNAFAMAKLKVGDMLDWFDQAMQGMAQLPPPDEVPSTVEISASTKAGVLRIDIQSR